LNKEVKELIRYVIKRVLWLIPVIICVSLIVFILMDLAPGTIVDAIHSDEMTAEDRAVLIAKYDLDKPLLYRYGKYMFRLVQGDLGMSDKTGLPIWSEFILRLPKTLLLSFVALIIGAVVSIPLGIVAARRAGTLVDNGATLLSLVGLSMPLFWLGLLLMLLFAYRLGWLPATGDNAGIKSLILPAVCSSVSLMAQTARQTRSNMLEVLNADYLRTARAKGVPEEIVIRRHALGNAWIPILTALGAGLSSQLAGSVVVETTFAWPGIGRMAAEAVLARDVTKTCGVVIMTTILYVLVQLIVDLLYAFVDPRIKAQYTSARKRKRAAFARAAVIAEGARESGGLLEAPLGGSLDAPLGGVINSRPVLAQAAEAVILSAEVRAEDEVIAGAQIQAAASVSVEAQIQAAASVSAESQEPVSATASEIHTADKPVKKSAKPDEEIEQIIKRYRKRSRMGEIFHSMKKNKGAMAGIIILVFLLLVFFGSLFLSFETATARDVPARFTPPSWKYPFGTDNMGRNTFLNVIYGLRYSLAIGFGAAGMSTLLGVLLGAIAGFYGGTADNLIMRFSDVVASIPGLLFGMVIITTLGQSLGNLIIAVGVTGMPIFIRMTRASILTVRNHEYVEAARAVGLRNPRTILSHVLPNGLSPIIVTITASLGITIIVAASLSYLGFGVPAPHPEWGRIISANKEYARSAPWIMTFPGLAIMITVLAFNLFGDGLRDALDPKLKR
jgi:ABC-type dipeptide/oligopeptide/nickel transport system permease component